MKTKTVALFLLAFYAYNIHGQSGFLLPKDARQVEIPFEYVNNFIILDITLNGTVPLKFIFDTGAEHTILTKREIGDLLRFNYEREFHVKGSDLKTELIAYLARNVRMEVAGSPVKAPLEDILVLKEDYFRFEEFAGVSVHGILAGRVFSNYIIKINYQRGVITLIEPSEYKKVENGFKPIPVEVYRNKLYLHSNAQLRSDSAANVKLLLDTGAAMPLMLFTHTHPLIQPGEHAITANIGMGLGGYLEGFVGRTERINLGDFTQNNLVTYYQSVDTTQDLSYLNGRNGLVGNTLLNHFELMIDYNAATVWLKPTRITNREFVYDRSGLNLVASGIQLNHFTVLNVLPGSPAEEAGIQAGDQVIRIGWLPTSFRTLADIQRLMKKKPGTAYTFIIKRDGRHLKKRLVLRDLI